MSNKNIIIPERDILARFDEMCQESLSPEIYSSWKDEIIPALKKIRTQLQEPGEKKIGMYGDTPRIAVGRFLICDQHEPADDQIWIEEVGVHGGVFSKEVFEKAVAQFLSEHI